MSNQSRRKTRPKGRKTKGRVSQGQIGSKRVDQSFPFSTVSVPITYTTTTGTDAGFRPEDSGYSFGPAGASMPINPIAMGGRAQLMASQFRQWRIRRARCRYRTFVPISGGTTLLGGSLNTPGQTLINMAWFTDPTVAPIGWDNVKNDGAISFTLDRNSRWINIPACGWKWFLRDPTTANYADFRSTLHGLLVAYAFDESASTINNYDWGFIEFEIDWQFRGYTDTNSDAVSSTTTTHSSNLLNILSTCKDGVSKRSVGPNVTRDVDVSDEKRKETDPSAVVVTQSRPEVRPETARGANGPTLVTNDRPQPPLPATSGWRLLG